MPSKHDCWLAINIDWYICVYCVAVCYLLGVGASDSVFPSKPKETKREFPGHLGRISTADVNRAARRQEAPTDERIELVQGGAMPQ